MESAAALWPARNRVFSPRRVFGDFLRVQKVTRLSGRDPTTLKIACRDETRRPSPFRAPGRNRKPAHRYGNRQKKETARALLCAGSCHRGSSTW